MDGKETTEDDKHTGRLVAVTNVKKVTEVQECIPEDRRVNVENVARHLVFRMEELRALCPISLECAVFRQDGYRACCLRIKWGKGL